MATDLEQAVASWIRAEYYFRLGPNAYQTPEQDSYLKAEAKLRRALTRRGELGEAFKAVGGKERQPRRVKKKDATLWDRNPETT